MTSQNDYGLVFDVENLTTVDNLTTGQGSQSVPPRKKVLRMTDLFLNR